MTISQIFDWLTSFTNLEKIQAHAREYRLDRMQALLDQLDHPERDFISIHIAGSKGKGSTCHFIAQTLAAAGIHCGIFASPHVLDWRERICKPDSFFTDQYYQSAQLLLQDLVEKNRSNRAWEFGDPSTFELLCLMAFLIFKQSAVQVAVLETGLGGRLDATNTIQPCCCAITHLELEHCDILGPTIQHIAREKGGIIKQTCPVFSAPQVPEAEAVLRAIAKEKNAPLEFINLDQTTAHSKSLAPQLAENAQIAAHVCKYVLETQFPNKTDRFQEAFTNALNHPMPLGRNSIYESKKVKVLVDGAHTVDSIQALCNWISQLPDFNSNPLLIFALTEGKREEEIIKIVIQFFKTILITRPGTFKASKPEELYKNVLRSATPAHHIQLCQTEAEAWHKALGIAHQEQRPVIVCGSFYLAAEICKLSQESGFTLCP